MIIGKIHCDGVLARVVSQDIASLARKAPCPVVNVSSLLKDPGVPTVRRDDRGIARACAAHLMERWFTRFGIVEMPYDDWCFTERSAGFVEGVRAEMPHAPISVHRIQTVPMDVEGRRRLRTWLNTLERPTGLFLLDDGEAAAVFQECANAGFRIPQDFGVIVGCAHPDDIRRCHPSLTHPDHDGNVLIEAASDYLDELMRNSSPPVQTITLEIPPLISGDSTDTIAVDDPIVSEAVAYMNARFREGINVADVVDHLGRSSRIIEIRFRNLMKITMQRYLMKRRVEFAQHLLDDVPRQSTADVAKAAGFSNGKALVRAFRIITGDPPELGAMTAPTPNVRKLVRKIDVSFRILALSRN